MQYHRVQQYNCSVKQCHESVAAGTLHASALCMNTCVAAFASNGGSVFILLRVMLFDDMQFVGFMCLVFTRMPGKQGIELSNAVPCRMLLAPFVDAIIVSKHGA